MFDPFDASTPPASFPLAWRQQPPPRARAPPTTNLNKKLQFFADALRALPDRDASVLAVEALTIASFEQLPFVANQPKRDDRVLDPRASPMLDFASKISIASSAELDELCRVSAQIGEVGDDADARVVSQSVYEVLASIEHLFDALKLGTGEELAPFFAAAAAAHAATSASATPRDMFSRVVRRVANAGRLLRSQTKRPALVLLGPRADLDEEGVTPRVYELGLTSIAVVVALGDRVPVLQQGVVADRQCAFVTAMRRVATKITWSVVDTLVPCDAVPIRTKNYALCMKALCDYATKHARAFAEAPPLVTPEQTTAWAIVAIVSQVDTTTFARAVAAWSALRAHEPPTELGSGPWATTRALLAQHLDVGALLAILSAHLQRLDERSELCRRIAVLYAATRTPNGIKLLASAPFATFVLDALEVVVSSPSGLLEFGDYERMEFGEWGVCEPNNTATAVCQRVVDALDDRAVTHQHVCAALRLTLVAENLCSVPFRRGIETIRPALERALRRLIGGSGLGSNALTFRRRCARALARAARPSSDGDSRAALVAWISTGGSVSIFARSFNPETKSTACNSVVAEFELALRHALAATDVGSARFLDENSEHVLRGASIGSDGGRGGGGDEVHVNVIFN